MTEMVNGCCAGSIRGRKIGIKKTDEAKNKGPEMLGSPQLGTERGERGLRGEEKSWERHVGEDRVDFRIFIFFPCSLFILSLIHI